MKVRYNEGVAIYIDPEPCAGIREVAGEASVGEHAGQPSSPEKYESRMSTPLDWRKTTWSGALLRVLAQSGVVADPGMHGRSLYENREISGSAISSHKGMVRSGKARSRSR